MCRYIQSPPISLQSAAFTINTAPCAQILSICEDESLVFFLQLGGKRHGRARVFVCVRAYLRECALQQLHKEKDKKKVCATAIE